MNETFKVFFKVPTPDGKAIITGMFDKEYKSKPSAKRFMTKLSEKLPGVEMEVANTNPFI